MRAQLQAYFQGAGGAGPLSIEGPGRPRRLRGVLSPHIDFRRGGPVYTWSYRELAEQADIDTFVILGVAHQTCRHQFALTLKDFETPLGVVPTDRQYVERIAAAAGEELFDDELVHRAEHSIEFQVVWLQYVLGKERPFSIVPILVGSFHDHLQRGIDPIEDPQVRRFHRRPQGGGGSQRQERRVHRRDRPVPRRARVRRSAPRRWPASGNGSPVRRRDARSCGRRRSGAVVPDGGEGVEPLAGLRACRHIHHASCHRPSNRAAAALSSGARRSANLLRELRQHGLSHTRGSARPGTICHQCSTQSPDDSLQPPAADSGPLPTAGLCRPPADFRHEVRQYDERATVGTWSGPRYRMVHRFLGQGPTLIWLPGIASTYRTYALVLNRLAERFRTIQYEYPGDRQGDGARLGRISHDHLVEDLIGLMDHLGIGRAHLAGISFGSTIALAALERAPGRFSRAVVQGAFAHRRFTAAERLALFWAAGCPEPRRGCRCGRRSSPTTVRWSFPGSSRIAGRSISRRTGRRRSGALAHRTSLVARLDLRPSPAANQRGTAAGSGTRRPDCAAPLFRGAESGAAARRERGHALGRPHPPHHARRVDGQADRRLAAALRSGNLHA